MNKELCKQFMFDDTVNPMTGRKIKIGGPTYKRLFGQCESINEGTADVPGEATGLSPRCVAFLNNPSVNPDTGRKIIPTGAVYKRLAAECVRKSPAKPRRKSPPRAPVPAKAPKRAKSPVKQKKVTRKPKSPVPSVARYTPTGDSFSPPKSPRRYTPTLGSKSSKGSTPRSAGSYTPTCPGCALGLAAQEEHMGARGCLNVNPYWAAVDNLKCPCKKVAARK